MGDNNTFDGLQDAIDESFEMSSIRSGVINDLKKRVLENDDIFVTIRGKKNKEPIISNTLCTICQYTFKSNQIIRMTCINCFFHAKCIDKWIINTNVSKCPNCMKIL